MFSRRPPASDSAVRDLHHNALYRGSDRHADAWSALWMAFVTTGHAGLHGA